MSDAKEKSPNAKIDKAIEKMLKGLDSHGDNEMMPELKLKTIQVAINWEKAKHAIRGEEEFDPDAIG